MLFRSVEYLKWDVVKNYSTEAVTRLTYHNLYMYVYTCDNVEKLVNSCPLEVLAELIPNDLVQILKSMEEMFESANPISVYEKYRQFYVKFGGENVMNIAKEVHDEFFDFNGFNSFVEPKEVKPRKKKEDKQEEVKQEEQKQ